MTIPILGFTAAAAALTVAAIGFAPDDGDVGDDRVSTTEPIAMGQTVGSAGLAPSIAAAIGEDRPSAADLPSAGVSATPIYFNDFADPEDEHRIDSFVHYRDPFVVNHTTGTSDHADAAGAACGAPETTRTQTRERPQDHVYLCHPGGDSALGHMMGFAMDTSGYGFVGGLPDQVFENVQEVSVDINTTTAGLRNFVEIKVLPADQTYVNAMPCGPDLPCNEGWDYDDVGGVGASTDALEGTGMTINTPARPDGYIFDEFNTASHVNGDIHHRQCDPNSEHCFVAHAHFDNQDIRTRWQHTFRDNGDGTLSFGIREENFTRWVTAPGSFPDGPVRVVVAFHNYTGTKDGAGPGFADNFSPSTGGFTWHWDNLAVVASTATPVEAFFGGTSPDRIISPNGCVAFSQGQRNTPHETDIAPEFAC